MRKTTIAAVLVALMELGGCAKVRYPDFYALKLPAPISASATSARISTSVAVREFRAPPYLRQGSIVYRPESERIAFYDYHRWAEDPRQSVTDTIVRELRQVFESVDVYDGRSGAELLLTGSLDRLEEVDSERSIAVEVELSGKLQNVKTGNTVWSDTFFKTSNVNERSVPAVVAEMSRDLSEAAAQMVSSMRSKIADGSYR